MSRILDIDELLTILETMKEEEANELPSGE